MFSSESENMLSYTKVEDSPHDALHEAELNFPGLESDPYHQLDNVTRGVSICQLEDVTRGMSMFSGMGDKGGSSLEDPYMFSSGKPFIHFEDYEYSQPGGCSEIDPSLCAPWASASLDNCDSRSAMSRWNCTHVGGFEEHHVPPRPSSSRFFAFEPTTLFVEFCSPQQIGNSLVTFLSSEVVASITKVRLQKYSIKAEVFVEGKSCAIKLRVYSQESDGKYAVEVQRCAGDALVLQSTFHLLKNFLQVNCGSATVQGDAPAPLARPALLELKEDEEQEQEKVESAEVIAPLLMMATVAGLQAEAASTLAAMVKEGRTSAAPLL